MYTKEKNAIACLSGGLGSFLSAYLYKITNPDKHVIGYFNDTLGEDDETYRFLREGADWLKIPLVEDCDGRTIWEVFRDKKYQGNNRSPNCSIILKIEKRVKWLQDNTEQGIDLIIGFDWTEIHRVEKAIANEKWANIVSPLVEDFRLKQDIYGELSNPPELPNLYAHGFPHSNCGGACVQAGLGQWASLLHIFPERYLAAEAEQEKLMAEIPNVRPFLRQSVKNEHFYLTLKEYRMQLESKPKQLNFEFSGGCGCAF